MLIAKSIPTSRKAKTSQQNAKHGSEKW